VKNDAGTGGTGNTLGTPQDRATTSERSALEEFIRLLKEGPPNGVAAPNVITLPPTLFAGIQRAGEGAYSTGNEHGGIFGYVSESPPKLGILYGEGSAAEFNFAVIPPWPALKPLGRFHTHLRVVGDRGGWAGGGFSGTDLANFYYRDERVSMVFALAQFGKWKTYFLLKPQEYSIPGSPTTVGKQYEARVLRSVERGDDPINASEKELVDLARRGAFVYYSSEGSPTLTRR